jgi:hypothetical protein
MNRRRHTQKTEKKLKDFSLAFSAQKGNEKY